VSDPVNSRLGQDSFRFAFVCPSASRKACVKPRNVTILSLYCKVFASSQTLVDTGHSDSVIMVRSVTVVISLMRHR
jgi:hypothetical protein